MKTPTPEESIAMTEIDEKTKDEVGIRKYFLTVIFHIIWQGTDADTVASTAASATDSSKVSWSILRYL